MRRWRLIAVCASIVVSGCATTARPRAAEPMIDPDFARFCTSNPCRGQTIVDLVTDDGTPLRVELPMAPPIVQPGFVTIYAGESIILEADVEGDRLVNLRAVPQLVHPDRSIQLRFHQDTTMRHGTDMVLLVQNGFSQRLKYRLGMLLPSDPEPPPGQPPPIRRTTSCPVLPGQAAYEHWPHAIFLLVATEFHLVDGDDPTAAICE